jgi:hypothetical protein
MDKWVSINATLPDQLERVWFATIDGDVYLGHRAASGFFDYLVEGRVEDVTHWMLCVSPEHPDF